MLRFLATIKVITTKQRNKFKNNNREGGDEGWWWWWVVVGGSGVGGEGEKARVPSGARKQQEPVSL